MSSEPVFVACAVCFGAADGPLLDAARLGVLVMAGFTAALLTALATFFLRVARRSASSEIDAVSSTGPRGDYR